MPPKNNRKCSVDGCDAKHSAKGFCKSHYMKNLLSNPERRARKNKEQLQKYYDNHEERKKKKRVTGKLQRAELYKKLGGKCISCGEKFNETLSRSNLELHHKFYDEDDERVRKKFKGNLGSKHIWEIRRMIKNGENPKIKFALLCKQCNVIEAHVRINPTKAFETFCWLYGEGQFDEALKDDPTLKKLTDFLK